MFIKEIKKMNKGTKYLFSLSNLQRNGLDSPPD